MPRFEPFPALRYATDSLAAVCAPPYDVLSVDDRARLANRHPHNIVHVDVPLEADGPDRYDKAASILGEWIRTGVLALDPTPAFTIYRMDFEDAAGRTRTTNGVIGGLEVVDEGAGGVLPHERTTPKAKTDRLDLTRSTTTNLSPVWGLSLAASLTDLLATPGEDVGRVEADGVVHRFERIDDPVRVRAITEHISQADVVIADGHHRYAISRTFRDEQRHRDTGTAGRAEFTMTFVQELVESQLSVAAIHRLYNGVRLDDLVEHLSRSFDFAGETEVTPEILSLMDDKGCLVLVRPDGIGTCLVPRPDAFVGQRDLDGARLEQALAALDHEVTYQHGVDNVLGVLRSGGAAAGILIRPVTVDEIRRTASEGLLMPPKSTFFTPKLLTGPVLRPMSDSVLLR